MKYIDEKKRFEFGKNWSNFLQLLSEERILEAENSLKLMLNVENLNNKKFLDIGSGSGLFSLAARRLGASVISFDYDLNSVNCTKELKIKYYNNDNNWEIFQNSALDIDFMKNLGEFDIVYSWGVLHHTGAMWLGIENSLQKVKPGGLFFIALYNDQGLKSHIWWLIKYLYNILPAPINIAYAYLISFITNVLNILKHTILLKPQIAINSIFEKKKNRGMQFKNDMLDWIGGFPFEFVKFDTIVSYFITRNFYLQKAKKATSLGCHEIVFKKIN